MNRILRQLLGEATAHARWEDLLVLENYAPTPNPHPHDYVTRERGFNIMILGRDGEPKWFCKVRNAAAMDMPRATRIRAMLSQDDALREIVPYATTRTERGITVQVAPFLDGERYSRYLKSVGPKEWRDSAAAVLSAAALISERASALEPSLVDSAPGNLAVLIQPHLARLVEAGLPPKHIDALANVARDAGTLDRHLQHGDLWGGNLLRHAGGWWILDYEEFGMVQLPLYDASHFVRSCAKQMRPRSAEVSTWLDRMRGDDDLALACRSVLAQAAFEWRGLTRAQALGAFAFYLAHRAALLVTRQVAPPYLAELLSEVNAVAAGLHAGEPVTDLFFGRS
jgi:hypothetical protein